MVLHYIGSEKYFLDSKRDRIHFRVPSAFTSARSPSLIPLRLSGDTTIDENQDEEFFLLDAVINETVDDDSLRNDMIDTVQPLLDELSLDASETVSNASSPVLEHSELLHGHSNIRTAVFCRNLLHLLRETGVCKSKSKAYLDLIRSALPHPNNLPSSMAKLFAMLDLKTNLFQKRTLCILCQRELSSSATRCDQCGPLSNETNLAFIFDNDLNTFLDVLLKRLRRPILDYIREVKTGVDNSKSRDIPFGSLYQDLLRRHPNSNMISALLHLDGISLAKSSKLKLWLFSFAIVELPPTLRFARHNMPVVSLWIGYSEPTAELWLGKAMSTLSALKSTGNK